MYILEKKVVLNGKVYWDTLAEDGQVVQFADLRALVDWQKSMKSGCYYDGVGKFKFESGTYRVIETGQKPSEFEFKG